MMSEEVGDLQPAMGAVTPEKGKGRRYSTGQTHSTGDKKKSVEPHYLRTSTGSCHDLCKYGRRHETEIKPWSSGHRRRIDMKPPEKIVTTDEVFPKRKNYLKAKPESSSVSKGHLPDSSSASKQKISSSEKRTIGSNNVGKSKESSLLKSSATPGCLSQSARTVKERVSPDFEVSKPISVKVADRRISGKSATPLRTKNAIVGRASFSKSLASSGLKSKDRKAVENTGISNRMRVKNAVIASTSSVRTKSSAGSARTSVKRKSWKPKTVIGQLDQKIGKDHGIRRIEKEVPPEKTLYVIDVESNDEVKNFNVSEINVVNELPESKKNVIILERPPSPSPSPSPSVAESSSQQNSSTLLTLKEGKEGMENSCIKFSHHEEEDEEEGDYADDDDEEEDEEVGSEYSDGESEIFSDSESCETQNKEGESTSTADTGVGRRSREAVRVHPEGANYQPVKLKFRRGRVVEIQSDNNTPRRLKFRRHKTLGEDEARTRPQRRVPKKREVAADPDYVSGPNSEKYALRRSDVQEKKDGQGGLFNNVIEETASKLVETRKSKVKALVGAFETVISLQDGKPLATNTS